MKTVALSAALALCKEPGTGKRIIDAAKAIGTVAGAITAVLAVPLAMKKFYVEFFDDEDE